MTTSDDRPWDTGEAYPWRGHVLRQLGLVLDFHDDQLVTTMPIGPHVLDRRGHLDLGALGLLVDFPAGVLSIQVIQPDWTVTFDVEAHVVPRPVTGTIARSVGSVVRRGRNNVITEARVTDESGALIGQALVTFTRLERTPEMTAIAPPRRRQELVDPVTAAGRASLPEMVGLEIDAAASRASFYPGRSVANALGAIQGGVTITAMTHAAAALVSHELSAPAAATDIHVYYTGLGTVGPYEVRSELLRCDGAEALVRNELVDTGADDRLLALGTVSARAC